MIGTFGSRCDLPPGLRCPPSRGAGGEPNIVLKVITLGTSEQPLAILAVFSFEPGQYLFMQIVQDHQLLLHSVLNDLFNRFFFFISFILDLIN